MAAYTQLSPIALPGKRYSFFAKTPAARKGLGPFTAQSVTATPGIIHSFVAKAPGEKGEGLFTELSVLGIPGMRHVFLPKTVALVSAYSPPPYLSHGHGGWGPEAKPWWQREEIRKKVLRDDDELFEMIAAILPFIE